MRHQWDRVGFIHWPYHPDLVQRLLPPGLEVQTLDGAAWVGLIPFVVAVRVPAWAPRLPVLGRFPEINVRTYVRGPGGLTGIWFASLEAPRLLTGLVARAIWKVPYLWATVRHQVVGGVVTYRSRRLRPGSGHPSAVLMLEPGEPLPASDRTEFDEFVTARFRLWSSLGGELVRTEIEHPPWPLRRARLVHLEENLLRAAGLPAPTTDPLVRYSDRTDVVFAGRIRHPAAVVA